MQKTLKHTNEQLQKYGFYGVKVRDKLRFNQLYSDKKDLKRLRTGHKSKYGDFWEYLISTYPRNEQEENKAIIQFAERNKSSKAYIAFSHVGHSTDERYIKQAFQIQLPNLDIVLKIYPVQNTLNVSDMIQLKWESPYFLTFENKKLFIEAFDDVKKHMEITRILTL